MRTEFQAITDQSLQVAQGTRCFPKWHGMRRNEWWRHKRDAKQIWWEILIAPMASMALARCCRFNSRAKALPALACSLQPHILYRGGSCSL